MSKITIDLPTDTMEKLKKLAEEDYRQLGNYLKVQLIRFANQSYISASQSSASLVQPLISRHHHWRPGEPNPPAPPIKKEEK